MKTFWVILSMFLAVGAFGQSGQVRTFDTLNELTARWSTPDERINVRHRSATALWDAALEYGEYSTSVVTNTPDGTHVVTNARPNSVYQSLQAHAPIQHPEWFGAVGDGVTDDTAALRALAAYVQAMGSGGIRVGRTYLVRGSGSTMSVLAFTNLTGFTVVDAGGRFLTDDYATNTFKAVSLTISGTTATATTATAHGLTTGNLVVVQDSTIDGYQGDYTITVTSPTTFTYTIASFRPPSGPGTAIARKAEITSTLFRFVGCRNIDLGSLLFSGTQLDQSIQYRLGWIVAQFQSGCSSIRGLVDASGAAYAVWSGDYGAATGDSYGFDIEVRTDSVGYPVALWGSGHRSRFSIDAVRAHRGAYIGGVKSSTFNIGIREFDVMGALITTQPDGTGALLSSEFLDVTVNDTGSTNGIDLPGVGTYRYLAGIGGYNVAAPVTNRNITVRVSAKNSPHTSGLYMTAIRTNHGIDGVTLTGDLDYRGLASTNIGRGVYLLQDSVGLGTVAGLDLSLRTQYPTNVGGLTDALTVTNMLDNPRLTAWETGIGLSMTLPLGIEKDVVPVFPGFDYQTAESMAAQSSGSGLTLVASYIQSTLADAIGTNDFSLTWVGDVPDATASGFLAISSATNGASAGALAVGSNGADLQVKLYGASTSDYRQATITNWQYYAGGRVAQIGVSRTNGVISLWADGHRRNYLEATVGTAPAWADAITATNLVVGRALTGETYSGTLRRVAVWNTDMTAYYPALATAWKSGELTAGAAAFSISPTIANGGFETLGGGGADVFGTWTESAAGSSTIYRTNDCVGGTNAAAFYVDGSNSGVAVLQAPPMVDGAQYQASFWAKASGTANIAIDGTTQGEIPFNVTTSWQRFTAQFVAASSYFQIKRQSAAGITFLVDDVTLRRVGALADFDFTHGVSDQLTGAFPYFSSSLAAKTSLRSTGMALRNDDEPTLYAGLDSSTQVYTNLTAARSVTLSTAGAQRGDWFRLGRADTTTNALTAAGVAIPTNAMLHVVYGPTGWYAAGFMGRTNLPIALVSGLQAALDGKQATNVMLNALIGLTNGIAGQFIASRGSNQLGWSNVVASSAASVFVNGATNAWNFTNDFSATGTNVTLAPSGVSAGTFPYATVTVDAKGRVTGISSNAASGGSSTTNYLVQPVFVSTTAVTIANTNVSETTIIGSLQTGGSLTASANTLVSGTVLRMEAAGVFSAVSDWSGGSVRAKIGGLILTATFNDSDSYTPTSQSWRAFIDVVVTTAGTNATVSATGTLLHFAGDNTLGVLGSAVVRTFAVTGTLDTTASNTFDLTFQNAASQEITLVCNSVWMTKVGAAVISGSGGSGSSSPSALQWVAAQAQSPASNYPSFTTVNAFGALSYDKDVQQETRFIGVLPEGYTASTIDIHIAWVASPTSGDCIWGAKVMRGSGAMNADSFGSATEATTTTSGTSYGMNTTTLSAVDLDSAVAGETVIVAIYRKAAAGGDTLNAVALPFTIEGRQP